LIGLGWSLVDAPLGLVPTALLAVLFDLKARPEEAWLIGRFPDLCPGSTEPSQAAPGEDRVTDAPPHRATCFCPTRTAGDSWPICFA
jgi:hypothetical protein